MYLFNIQLLLLKLHIYAIILNLHNIKNSQIKNYKIINGFRYNEVYYEK